MTDLPSLSWSFNGRCGGHVESSRFIIFFDNDSCVSSELVSEFIVLAFRESHDGGRSLFRAQVIPGPDSSFDRGA
jgi:hypothetical protein